MTNTRREYSVYHVRQTPSNRQHKMIGRYRHLASAVEVARAASKGNTVATVVRDGVMVANCRNTEINWFST